MQIVLGHRKKLTQLSDVTLGISPAVKNDNTYRHHGVKIKKMRKPSRRGTRYKLIEPPPLRWFPSRTAAFTFGPEYTDTAWLYDVLPERFNASVWQNQKNSCYTLRVPRDLKTEAIKELYGRKQGFWFNTAKYMWFLRRKKRSRYPGSLQSEV